MKDEISGRIAEIVVFDESSSMDSHMLSIWEEMSAISQAIKNEDVDLLSALLADNLTLVKRSRFLSGYSFLIRAAESDSIKAAKFLLDVGFDPSETDLGGRKPMDAATSDEMSVLLRLYGG